ncbi:MAG: GNAT family N-acetyltransferase [Cellulosilyticaceae bacterium]
MIHHEKVIETDQVLKVEKLASNIWRQHYTPIIGEEQVDYMLANLQNAKAIKEQIKEKGYEYYLLYEGQQEVGYIAIQCQEDAIFLSKLYIEETARGKGVGSYAFNWVENMGKERGYVSIWLTVNRNNTDSITIYTRKGFKKIREEQADIGAGFIMDDYIMEKSL